MMLNLACVRMLGKDEEGKDEDLLVSLEAH